VIKAQAGPGCGGARKQAAQLLEENHYPKRAATLRGPHHASARAQCSTPIHMMVSTG